MKTVFEMGYEAAMAKLGAAVGMRGGKHLSHSQANQPLESGDINLPAGQMALMFQDLPAPSNKRTAQKARTNFKEDVDWTSPMEVAGFTGSSPLFSSKG
jgi:hypothetical protein